MDQIHTPERLENESMEAYRSRRRIARLLANRTRLVAPDKIEASSVRRARRMLNERLGSRQAKKLLRRLKEARAQNLAAAQAEAA